MSEWNEIVGALKAQGIAVDAGRPPRAVGGGDISAAWRVETNDGAVFLKTGSADEFDMFEAEAEGLVELAQAEAVRVPAVLGRGIAGGRSFLAIEWLDTGAADAGAADTLGRQLAALHRVTADRHGWHRDNTIGSTPQVNTRCDDWTAFFRRYRLGFQLELAAANGYRGRLQTDGAELADGLEALFDGHQPAPSLLHGDLWGGNWAAVGGDPVVFDPAVYYGDRETDLAMTRLFGGFPADFYAAYEEAWPLPPGHADRLALYQLYHVLNHLNLFGSGYLGRAESLIRRLLAALR